VAWFLARPNGRICLLLSRAKKLFASLPGLALVMLVLTPLVHAEGTVSGQSGLAWKGTNGNGSDQCFRVEVLEAFLCASKGQHHTEDIGDCVEESNNGTNAAGYCVYLPNGNLLGTAASRVTQTSCPINSTKDVLTGLCTCNKSFAPNGPAANACVPVKDIDRTSSPPNCSANPPKGNPIYPLLGTKREDLDTGVAIGKLRLRLVYDNAAAAPMSAGGIRPAVAKPPVLGALWSSTLHRKVLIQANGKGALVARGDGRTVLFNGNGAGIYTGEADVSDHLLSITGGYRYVDVAAQTQETYDAAGKLTAIHWASAASLTLSYSTGATAVAPEAGYLLQAQDSYGRTVAFTYQLPSGADPTTGGLLASITDAQGQATTLAYDATANLTGITWADGKSRAFHYEDAAVTKGLTGITDELGVRYATFGYDSQGRAISTEYTGGVGRYSASYTTPPQVVVTEVFDAAAQVLYRYHDWATPQGTSVATPQGTSLAMGATTINGKNYLTSQSQPAGSGCAASTSAMTYDANGNLASRDDFNGTRACYTSDLTRNLAITKVEGLANTASCAAVTTANATLPAGSRKTSTQWHPDWPIAVRVAEPGRRITSVYNGQPDPTASNAIVTCAPTTAVLPDGKPIAVLCKQVEQATTDANGALGFTATLQAGVTARTRQWTYNQAGQVLTDKDPLNHTTSFGYYTASTADYRAGDLQSVTNAVSKTTSYTKYNGNGQLLETIDANGVATVNSYDARGRLLTSSVGGQAVSYSYDFSGQPTRTTQADGSWTELEYDAARRMNAVKDSLGNRIDYTLDNEGRVTAQTVKDPQGNVTRTLTRSIDALGRVQQITGKQ
jgi:YD repeat-containing protein